MRLSGELRTPVTLAFTVLAVAGVAALAVLVGVASYPYPPAEEKYFGHIALKHFLLWAQAVGIPVAIGLFVVGKRNERRDREYGTYDSLDDKYLQYLQTCLAHPQLDVFDLPLAGEDAREPSREELIIYTTLVSILERAFLLYDDKSAAVRRRQWTGWSQYIDVWVARAKFRRAWQVIGDQFDERFTQEIARRMDRLPAAPGQSMTIAT